MTLSVLSVNAGADTAGQGIRMKQGFDRYAPDWTFHSAARTGTYIAYPTDVTWDNRVTAGLWEQADVVHLHNNFRTAEIFERRRGDKPAVIHHHGTMFREGRAALLQETRRRGALGIVSTLDLYLIAPDDLEWLPAPYDVDWLASLRAPIDDGKIRIGSAPTNRTIKSTDAFLAAIERLKEDYPVELVLIEREDWASCLARKATVDIFFDQVILGYGCNAIEAWGMGIPVVAGASDPTLDEYERRFGYLPFHHATEDTIYEALRELVESPDLRSRMGALGNRYVREYHDDRKTVAQLQSLYLRAHDRAGRKAA